ncbi:MAG: DUF6455 family protein [Tistlia sp.]|uniref:DUF6455 family protein n=1 Tax=Tistlia sp. TaxID=3057121 RepID=UPI0034A42F38
MKEYLSRLDAKSRNLGRMMTQCGVDPARLAGDQLGQTMAATARACIACPHGAACALWLEAAAASGTTAPPHFCPNAGRFRSHRFH